LQSKLYQALPGGDFHNFQLTLGHARKERQEVSGASLPQKAPGPALYQRKIRVRLKGLHKRIAYAPNSTTDRYTRLLLG